MLVISRLIDSINTKIGKTAAWLILLSVIISAINATLRFTVDMAANWALEAQWQLFSVTFLFCAPWTLMLNEHIRIDVMSNKFSNKGRYWVDIMGHTFILLPFCALMVYTSIPVALNSFAINEQSFNANGLPQWPAKMMIPIAFTFLGLQAISELIKRVSVLRGIIDEPYQNLAAHSMDDEAEEPL